MEGALVFQFTVECCNKCGILKENENQWVQRDFYVSN